MGVAFARQVARKISLEAEVDPPINLVELLNWRGVALLQEESWPKHLCARYYSAERRISVNKSHILVRQRFSIAHELGHLSLGHDDLDVEHGVEKIFGDEDENFDKVEGDLEKDANAFATELLMPKAWIETRVDKLAAREIARLIQEGCTVSAAAAWYRVMELKLGEFASPRHRRR